MFTAWKKYIRIIQYIEAYPDRTMIQGRWRTTFQLPLFVSDRSAFIAPITVLRIGLLRVHRSMFQVTLLYTSFYLPSLHFTCLFFSLFFYVLTSLLLQISYLVVFLCPPIHQISHRHGPSHLKVVPHPSPLCWVQYKIMSQT